VVFVHPFPPRGSEAASTVLHPGTVDFLFDTTRAIANLLFTGSFDRWRDVRFIFAHAGGAAPYAAGRLKMAASSFLQPEAREKMQRGVIESLQSLHFDLALSAFPYALGGLVELVEPSQLLYGSDYYIASEDMAKETLQGIREFRGFDSRAVHAVERGSALRLFPRFADR
jgi:predicted TIM-barrel fold metal-dependent hydrolase